MMIMFVDIWRRGRTVTGMIDEMLVRIIAVVMIFVSVLFAIWMLIITAGLIVRVIRDVKEHKKGKRK